MVAPQVASAPTLTLNLTATLLPTRMSLGQSAVIAMLGWTTVLFTTLDSAVSPPSASAVALLVYAPALPALTW